MSSLAGLRLGARDRTIGDMIIPVDYNGASTVDAPEDAIFRTQADVQKSLGTALAFKHFQPVWNALPQHVISVVDFDFADGIQRPRPGGEIAAGAAFGNRVGWALDGKIVDNEINFNGALDSTWGDLDASLVNLTVDTISALPRPGVGFGSSHPGLLSGFVVSGHYLVTDQGQVTLIVGQSGDQLFTTTPILPTPTTVRIAKQPSTIFRSSIDDSTAIGVNAWSMSGLNRSSNLSALDITWEKVAGETLVILKRCDLNLTRCVANCENLALGPLNGAGWVVSDTDGFFSLDGCALLARQVNPGPDNPMIVFRGGVVSFFSSYCAGFDKPIEVSEYSQMRIFGGIFDKIAQANLDRAAIVYHSSQWDLFDTGSFRHENVFRNMGVKTAAIRLDYGSAPWASGTNFRKFPPMKAVFEDNAGPCVQVGSHIDIDTDIRSAQEVFADGGGNTDVGIEYIASHSRVNLQSNVTVAGSVGAVRLADGAVRTYTDILNNGPFTDDRGNIVSKVS